VPALAVIACAGAPRDLGLDQGRACRDAIRADLRAQRLVERDGWRRTLLGERRCDRRFARDLERHFPHLDERVAGLAAGVAVARDAAAALMAAELCGDLGGSAHVARTEPVLVLRFAMPLPPTGLVARTVRPDGGYPNLCVTRPGLVAALAGVNEPGLAGVAVLRAPARGDERCAAPGLLLLEQCIERLDRVDKALEWCERRPGGGAALLVFADATGARGAIEIDAERRRRVAVPGEPDPGPDGACVRVDAAARSVEVAGGGIESTRLELGHPVSGDGAGSR
jgi:hypothetical protein